MYTIEKIEKPESVSKELFNDINDEFEKLYPLISESSEEIRNIGEYRNNSEEKIKKDILENETKKLKELNSKDFYNRIFQIINNFFFWFPDGWYRDMKLDSKIVESKQLELHREIVESLDEIILESDISNTTALIAGKMNKISNPLERNEISLIVGDVYLKMLKKGFLNKDLIT